jgi:hypothetical protein
MSSLAYTGRLWMLTNCVYLRARGHTPTIATWQLHLATSVVRIAVSSQTSEPHPDFSQHAHLLSTS